jgi:hypothetical protein
MKIKFKIALVALLVPLMVLIVGFKAADSGKDTPTLPVPDNAVGVFVNGVPHIISNNLVWQFYGGGTINTIHFTQGAQGNWWMIRRGTKNGNYRTERFQVSISNGFLVYTPVWFFVCSASECSLCDYSPASNTCECGFGGGNCNFGGTIGPIEVEQVYVGNP